jgi:hypothetical protein
LSRADDELLTVNEPAGQRHSDHRRRREHSPSGCDRIGNPRARRKFHQTGAPHFPGNVDHDIHSRAGRRRCRRREFRHGYARNGNPFGGRRFRCRRPRQHDRHHGCGKRNTRQRQGTPDARINTAAAQGRGQPLA